MKSRAKAWLAHPRSPWVIVALALLLASPSLTGGFVADDHLQRIVMRDATGIDGLNPRALDLFVFADGDPASMQQLMDKGVFPWTTDPELKLAFSRPLSALTHRLDNALWPDTPTAMHVQNLLWFGLLLLVLGWVYRRIHGAGWVAGLALLMYALDDIHGPTFSWIANRQSLISACFGFAALGVHDRWRREGWRPGAWLAPSLTGLALLAGESGLATTGYLFAYACFMERETLGVRARAVSLTGHAAVAVAWVLAYRALGYGAANSGMYVDPGAEPLVFGAQLVDFSPVILTSQLAGAWSDIFPALPADTQQWYWWVCVIYLVLLLDALKETLKRPKARLWATGMLLSVVPLCATVPADRVLIFVGVGAMGMLACFFEAPEGAPGLEPGASAPPGFGRRLRRFSVRSWTVGMVVAHLVLGPLLMPVRARTMHTVGDSLRRSDLSLPLDADVVNKTVIGVNPPSDPYMAYVPLMRASQGTPVFGQLRWLAVGQTAVAVTRVDARTLAVTPEGGYLQQTSEQFVRRKDRRFAIDQVVALKGVTVTVTALTEDGRPAATRWAFEAPLEDDRYVWLRWGDDHLGWTGFEPPAMGATVTLPAIDTVKAFMGD